MHEINKEEQLEAVKGWWNSRKSQKWDKKYDQYDPYSMNYLASRQEKVLSIIKELELKKDSKVLELGYGAGQTAAKLVQNGFELHGIDVSEKFAEMAKRRCRESCPDGKFFFKTGNLESRLDYESNSFDLVIVVGVLQYLYDHNICLEEIYRVLKPGGYFIIAQKNAYSLSGLTSIRKIIRRFLYFVLREKYEIFPSLKAMLVDSRLGVVFERFEKSRIFNTRFMLRGHEFWEYKLRKRLIYYSYLKPLILRKGFRIIDANGIYFCLTENPKNVELNLKIDKFMKKIASSRVASWLLTYGTTIIFVSTKEQEK